MEDNARLQSLMKEAVELMRASQEKRREHREGKIPDAEASRLLKEYSEKFNSVQQRIMEEMKKS